MNATLELGQKILAVALIPRWALPVELDLNEILAPSREGGWAWVPVACALLAAVAGVCGLWWIVTRDVSTRRRAEAALRASEERLRRILETVNEGVWVVDSRGTIEFVNARMAETCDATEEQMVGRSFLDFVSPENVPLAKQGLEAILQGEKVHRELRHRRRDGSETLLLDSKSPLRAPDGRVTGAVAVFMDITAHRRAEEQLLQARKMEAIGRLVSGIAHDFNNISAVILSSCDCLLDQCAEDAPLRPEIQEIQAAGQRAVALVRQLLAFGRKSVFNPVRTDLNSVVTGVEKLLRRTMGENITVEVSLTAAPWPVRLDPSQIELVLMNLAVNARDAMPEGGSFRIETRNVEISEDREKPAAPLGREARLLASDTGRGMTPEVRSRIFEPFFTTKAPGKGTGLGLSTVFGIVQQAGGTIAVESEPGGGTTFIISFPTPYLEHADQARVHRDAHPHDEHQLLQVATYSR